MYFTAPAAQAMESSYSMLPLLIILAPMVGAVVCGLVRHRTHLCHIVASAAAFIALILAAMLFPLVQKGEVIFALENFIGLGLFFRVDFLGLVFTLFVSLIWFLVILNSTAFMGKGHLSTRYFVFMLFTLGGCLGVFLTADFFSLFLFFEAMTLFSYVLVVHEQSEEALAAGRKYLLLGIFGGLCLLSAILLLFNQTGTIKIVPNMEALAGLGGVSYLIALLFFIGFGIKAAAVPLHIWMPRAYEFAPSAVNAISSAAMLKAGAYGLIRVVALLFTPHDGHSGLWAITENLGYAVIWIGIVTMATGAVLALLQTHAKRVLAYSSISQMGYIMMGIGAAAYLGYEGAMGFAGASYHIINHAFFKAAMFLMIGAVYLRTRDLNYDSLGGLWRSFPVTAVAFLIAGAALSGFPAFNGYASKTLLHHAIVEAFEHHHVASLWFAEKIFVVTSGLTFCYVLRLFTTIFTGPARPDAQNFAAETALERVVFGTFAAVILIGGLLPELIISKIIAPMAGGFTYDAYAVSHLGDINVFSLPDLGGIAVSLLIGGLIFAYLKRTSFSLPLPNIPLPRWISIEEWLYQPIITVLLFAYAAVGRLVETLVEGFIVGSIVPTTNIARSVRIIERRILPWAGEAMLKKASVIRDRSHFYMVQKVQVLQVRVRQLELSVFSTMIKLDYNPRGEQLYRKLTLMNLDLCVFIILIMLVISLSIWVLRTIGL
jgi:hydrogenase-4 component B